MDYLEGVSEWTPEENSEKVEAITKAPRALVALAQSKLENEYIISNLDLSKQTETVSHYLSVKNAILSWCNFPKKKLSAFLDAVLAVAERDGSQIFTITNLEVGKQLHAGKRAKDAAVQKSISRDKRLLREWQDENGVELVEIVLGKFDPKRRRNEPTQYTCHILEWIPEILAIASSQFNFKKNKNLANKIIRKTAFEYLNAKAEITAPLRGYEPKTLSEEEKFDRRAHQSINHALKNFDLLHSLGMTESIDEYEAWFIREFQKAAAKRRGMVGNLITAFEDEPDTSSPVFHRLKNGELLHNDFERIDPNEYKHIPEQKKWDGEKLVPIEPHKSVLSAGQNESDNMQNASDSACKLLKTQAHGGTFLTENAEQKDAKKGGIFGKVDFDFLASAKSLKTNTHDGTFFESSAGQFEDQNSAKSAKTACNSLNPLPHGGTFLDKKDDAKCRSCEAPVLWKTNIDPNKDGIHSKMPIDPEPTDGEFARIALLSDGIHFRMMRGAAKHDPIMKGHLYSSHFDTCKFAVKHRKK